MIQKIKIVLFSLSILFVCNTINAQGSIDKPTQSELKIPVEGKYRVVEGHNQLDYIMVDKDGITDFYNGKAVSKSKLLSVTDGLYYFESTSLIGEEKAKRQYSIKILERNGSTLKVLLQEKNSHSTIIFEKE